MWYFSYGPKCNNAKIGQNWAISVEKHAVYTKFQKYITILWPMCFLVDLVRKNYERKKWIINIHFLQISLLRVQLKYLKSNCKTTNWLKKVVPMTKGAIITHIFFLKKFTFWCLPFFSDFSWGNVQQYSSVTLHVKTKT